MAAYTGASLQLALRSFEFKPWPPTASVLAPPRCKQNAHSHAQPAVDVPSKKISVQEARAFLFVAPGGTPIHCIPFRPAAAPQKGALDPSVAGRQVASGEPASVVNFASCCWSKEARSQPTEPQPWGHFSLVCRRPQPRQARTAFRPHGGLELKVCASRNSATLTPPYPPFLHPFWLWHASFPLSCSCCALLPVHLTRVQDGAEAPICGGGQWPLTNPLHIHTRARTHAH